ncbi:MAG: NUDIX domain-containing protein [FCB group bacterium]|jgi:hypothetical protein|nr:NUDIX domain-containing protein [FCB group bacterium]
MIHAAFIVAPAGRDNLIAATTRAADRNEAGRIGLPGGKVDPGESARDAAIREAAEEGWAVYGVEAEPYHVAEVEGRMVAWFLADMAIAREEFPEQGRIEPIAATWYQVAASGYGNDAAMAAVPAGFIAHVGAAGTCWDEERA